MRLIDADKLTSCIRGWRKIIKETYGINDEYYKCLGNVIDTYINDAPTVDAVPVVHGHWIDRCGGTYNRWSAYCSVCGKKCGCGGTIENQHKDYCPNCGADMRERKTDAVN